ncbi:GMC oxidoreductase [Desertihabitans aurantiacus]|uniref:GMC oxidoreductase n=1 Tax=Desertihabitans aurantiacus TaxID=2282477 RepID=UPI000DF8422D|nr:GMC oxidoreductase [Desertihabitans aurantiacus]
MNGPASAPGTPGPAGDGWVDALVVGSGFGGGVAAARLAQAGLAVVVLERGRRWPPGSFPRSADPSDGWLWQDGQGIFDVRWLRRMASVQAAGWGGGSLVYANVFARPAEQSLPASWPAHLRRSGLDPYYDLAAHMLEVSPMPDDPVTALPPDRTRAVDLLMRSTDIPEATVRPNLAVSFGDPERWRANRHGVPQRGCTFVGECVVGCNHGAKNTLDHNYLAVAERHGAEAVTGAEVVGLRPVPGGWEVGYRDPADPASAVRHRRATRVFLAAGALATTELLLRARDVDATLPGLSPRLGERFSGNGDFLALTNLRGVHGDLTRGPAITTTTVLDVPEGDRTVWFQVQDGSYPLVLGELVDALLPLRRLRLAWRRLSRTDPRSNLALLSMGHDAAEGRLSLDRRGRLVLGWQNRAQAHLYRSMRRVGPVITRALGSPVRSVITWRLLRRTITVHPLGGVPVGADATEGVVDPLGEVHGYPGLFVVDGSVLPGSTGVNPSATIAAVAERSLEQLVRRFTGQPGWRAPEWAQVRPTPMPEDRAFAFMARRRAATAGDGVVLAEHMASRPGAQHPVALDLRGEVRSTDAFLTDPDHPVTMRGTLTTAEGRTEVEGTLSLFPEDGPEAMRYRLAGAGSQTPVLEATKHVRGRGPLAVWRGLTTLHVVLPATGDRSARRTVAVMPVPGVIRLAASVSGVGFTRPRRLAAWLRFVIFFLRGAWRHSGLGRARPRRTTVGR